jgi:DNA-binding winged helix-turn-helix (wHTH) protein/tetratricopeptide (TPR) repeat protein
MRICPARREIQVNGTVRTLEPRVLQVLVALAEARPSVVARDELVAACWGGAAVSEDAINRCILALRNLAREFDPPPFTIETVARVGYALREGSAEVSAGHKSAVRRKLLALSLLIAAAALIAGAVAMWRPWRSDVVTVAIVPANSSETSRALAQDVGAKLGMFHIVSEGRAQLIDLPRAKDADLRFAVSAPRGSGMPTNVVLLNKRQELLWSKDFSKPAPQSESFEAQIAFAAGKVLACAIESQEGDHKLSARLAKIYLNGCVGLADGNESSFRDLNRLFEQVTRSAPDFEPAWRKLLMGEAATLDSYDRSDAEKLHARQIVQSAAKLNPALPQLDVVKSALLQSNEIRGRMKLVEEAYSRAPTDGFLADYYSLLLTRTGRLYESVTAARNAVRADPLSPTHRVTLVFALATAGRIAEAQEELRQAETLWPDSAALKEVHYTLSLRFTDPGEAIRLRDSGQLMPASAPWQGSFLAARADRTPAKVEQALRDARAMYASNWQWISHAAQTFGEFGREDELFDILLNWNRPDSVDFVTDVIFRPPLHNFRRDPRFILVAKRLGLLDYWKSSGKWPDFCFEADMPYDCKREATKLTRG